MDSCRECEACKAGEEQFCQRGMSATYNGRERDGKTPTFGGYSTRITVDEAYVRESILNPSAKVASGFQPIMPTFQGLVTEEQLLELIEYVKSLKALPQVQTR